MISCIRQEISREEASLRELCQLTPPSYKKRSRIATWITKQWRRRGRQPGDSVSGWSVDEVSSWLSSLGLPEYSEQFKANDVRGAELLHLEKADLNDLGVTKIGHIKRLQVGGGHPPEMGKSISDSDRRPPGGGEAASPIESEGCLVVGGATLGADDRAPEPEQPLVPRPPLSN